MTLTPSIRAHHTHVLGDQGKSITAVAGPFPLLVISMLSIIGTPGVRVVGVSTNCNDRSCRELTCKPCHPSPVIISPDRIDRALGDTKGPKSSACAVIGAETLTVYVEDEPGEIARSGVLSNSTDHPVMSV